MKWTNTRIYFFKKGAIRHNQRGLSKLKNLLNQIDTNLYSASKSTSSKPIEVLIDNKSEMKLSSKEKESVEGYHFYSALKMRNTAMNVYRKGDDKYLVIIKKYFLWFPIKSMKYFFEDFEKVEDMMQSMKFDGLEFSRKMPYKH